MSATAAPPDIPPGLPARDGRHFALAFAAASLAAIGAMALLPAPSAPRPARFVEAPPSPADRAAATLERASAARPMDAEALRRLADQLRTTHRPLQLAIALERLHALTGEPAPLREAMELRTDLGDQAAARAALDRLSAIGATTEAEALRLAALRIEGGDAAGAVSGLMQALARRPTPELALRTVQAAVRLPEPGIALRALGATLFQAAPDLLEALRRVLIGDSRPDLALLLLEGLPLPAQADPATAFALAQAEARAGWGGAALARLLALRATDGLPAGAGALLVDLALREGRLDEAFEVAALLPAEAWPAALPARLAEAARLAQRPELPRRIDPQRLAPRPEMAAQVALARGDRAAARRLAELALGRPPNSTDGARGLALVLRDAGQDQAAWDRLRRELQGARPDPGALRLFAELSMAPARGGPGLALLERHRADGMAAGEAWLRLALAEERGEEAARFLTEGGPAGAGELVEALSLAARRRDAALADASAAALRSRRDWPDGWTPEEARVTAALARPLGTGSLGLALDMLDWASEQEARNRIVLLLAAVPEIGAVAAQLPQLAQHPALRRLRREAEAGQAAAEGTTARLALLAVLSPRDAVPLLARRAEAEPARFGPAQALAVYRADGPAQGEASLRALLPRLARPQQEGTLFLLLGAAPAEARPLLARVADEVLGAGWRPRFEALLARQGRRAELVAALRARAAMPGEDRREIARRLAELGETDIGE
ncbi:hypothetical protein [Falsiroseomonas stagni]|uniref:Uncharacterized protein n=1 Tax=Falsiroseomonas stagni DSM 19981 TaxID=1123062 RepID=A0A1I3XV37_9PROT|nr:hypothetical protein [Falsiroseomonas stagni]SFK23390.1 hypothetical protein SAMN02745775_101682 [Falsiroseomonas stagni DSM 19981]